MGLNKNGVTMVGIERAWKAVLLVVVLLAGVAGQAFCFPEKVTDDRKKEIEIPAKPQRIVSLAPTNTELLFALGLDKEIVGVTKYCDYPEAAKQKEKIGGFLDVDLDRIVALKPDLILAFGTVQLPVVETLEKKGLRVFWLYPHTVDDILGSFERVGRVTGREREAKELRDAVAKDVGELRKTLGALPDDKRPTVLRVMNFDRPATIGAESFQTDLFFLAGGRSAFPAAEKDYMEIDVQELKRRDPAVLLLCGDDEKALIRQLKNSPAYRDLTAVKNDAIVVMPCELTCRPGPRIGEAARVLAQYLHPEEQLMNGHRPVKAAKPPESPGGCGCAAGR